MKRCILWIHSSWRTWITSSGDSSMTTKAQGRLKNKYRDHSLEFNAYLLINNYERERLMTETYIKTCIMNYILYMKPDVNFKDEHTSRNFYVYIIRDKQLSQATKIALTMACLRVYNSIDYFFSKDIYSYTAFHYSLLMGHYKVALQIIIYCDKIKDFYLQFHPNTKGEHEFHDHPLTFFIWKNAEEGVKKGSKKETLLKLLLNNSNNDVLLSKNKHGYSALDYTLERDRLKENSSKKQDRCNMISILTCHKLKIKYLYMVMNSNKLCKLSSNLKILIAHKLA
ncbi:unnamed protein product [Moneuplotes crassus]|uniref:Uncharacterized protein n=1 Tax=Euplotes crassus TaxID=5936 RepID=A0AAD2CZJ7_EUPCR|nr:unnamed protein product [Moneuplotes crassus]